MAGLASGHAMLKRLMSPRKSATSTPMFSVSVSDCELASTCRDANSVSCSVKPLIVDWCDSS